MTNNTETSLNTPTGQTTEKRYFMTKTESKGPLSDADVTEVNCDQVRSGVTTKELIVITGYHIYHQVHNDVFSL